MAVLVSADSEDLVTVCVLVTGKCQLERRVEETVTGDTVRY